MVSLKRILSTGLALMGFAYLGLAQPQLSSPKKELSKEASLETIVNDNIDFGINWKQATASAPWSKRYGHTSVVFNDKMWVMGGQGQDGLKNDVWSSTDGTNWIEETNNASWQKRLGHTSENFGGKIWVIGGNAGGGYLVNQDESLWNSSDGKSWVKVTAPPWTRRSDHSSAIFDNKIWVLGGWNSGWHRNDVWSSPDGTNWSQISSSAPWPGRSSFNSLVFSNNLWILGGYDGSYRRDVWKSPDGLNWERTTDRGPWISWGHEAQVFNDKMLVFGGVERLFSGDFSWIDFLNSDVGSFDGNKWDSVVTLSTWSPRTYFSSVVYKDKLWIFGGQGGTNIYPYDSFNDVWFSETFPIYKPRGFDQRIFSMTRDAYSFRNWSYDVGDLANDFKQILVEQLSDEYEGRRTFVLFPLYAWAAEHGGHCFGMAASSALYYENPSLKPVGLQSTETYNMLSNNPEVIAKIREFQRNQWPFFFERKFDTSDPKNQLAKAIEIAGTNGTPFIVDLTYRDTSSLWSRLFGKKGHIIEGFRIDDKSDIATITVYDSNIPSNSQTATINKTENTFDYLGADAVHYNEVQILDPFRSASREETASIWENARRKYLQLFFDENKDLFSFYTSPRSALTLQQANSFPYLITDNQGRRFGYEGSTFYNEIPGIEEQVFKQVRTFTIPKSLVYSVKINSTGQANLTLILADADDYGQNTQLYFSVPIKTGDVIELGPQSKFLKIGTGNTSTTVSPDHSERISYRSFSPLLPYE